jgi:hypothetical protein
MAKRKKPPAAGKKRKRRCSHCTNLFVPDHAGRWQQVCPFCGQTNYKPVPVTKLDERAWKLFSRLARFQRADREGYCTCATCSDRKPWQEMDAGHYMSRKYSATKYDWDNVWPQCKPCNSGYGTNHWAPDESVKTAWKSWLEHNVGPGAAEELWRKAMDGGVKKPSREELEALIYQLEMCCRQDGLPV